MDSYDIFFVFKLFIFVIKLPSRWKLRAAGSALSTVNDQIDIFTPRQFEKHEKYLDKENEWYLQMI